MPEFTGVHVDANTLADQVHPPGNAKTAHERPKEHDKQLKGSTWSANLLPSDRN